MQRLHDIDSNEVCRAYKEAKNKARQIDILAELNDCSVDDIVVILAEQLKQGYSPEEPTKQLDLMEILSRQMDNLDKEIHALEVKYKETTIAMRVVAEIMAYVERNENETVNVV